MRDRSAEVACVAAAVGLDSVDYALALVFWVRELASVCQPGVPDQPREQHTIVEARQAAVQSCLGPNLQVIVQGAASRLECLQTPLLLQGPEVDLLVLDPEVPHGIDPAHGHCLDVGALLGDMSVLGGVIFADDEVGNVGSQVVLVDAAEFICLLCYCCLRVGKGRNGQSESARAVNKATNIAH